MAHGRLADQPGAMGHQVPERDRCRRIARRELGQDRLTGASRSIALLDELHQGHVGEQLGDRADPVDRLRRRTFPASGSAKPKPWAQTIRWSSTSAIESAGSPLASTSAAIHRSKFFVISS